VRDKAVRPATAPVTARRAQPIEAPPSRQDNLLALEHPRQVPINWIVHVFILLGMAILLLTCLEMINTSAHFPVLGPFSTVGEGLRRAAYYFGIVLYSSSVRLLTGFALLSAGFLIARRAIERPGWDKAVRITGLVMCGVSIVYLLTALGLLLPSGNPPYSLTALLPRLWLAVTALVITFAALMTAGFLMATRLSSERVSLSAGLRALSARPRRRAAGGQDDVPEVAAPGADGGGTR